MDTEKSAAEHIDAALDAVLKASGSALKNYTLPGNLARMREVMHKIMLRAMMPNGSDDQYLLTHILYPVLLKLCRRYDKSCEKHGPWTSATLDMKMVEALKNERKEVDTAWIDGRIEGPHGEIDELYDEANCCVKRIFALTHGSGE